MSEVMYAPVIKTDSVKIYRGDCCDLLPVFKSGSVDAVITDPPYPCIKRDYGTWTEDDWFAMMRTVVPECMRILKPTGSAVFILQPNSEKVGRMRTWLWEFMAWVGKEWGIVQDAYWWNNSTLPTGGATTHGLMRGSLKACVWVGSADAWRNQKAVLAPPSARTQRHMKLAAKNPDHYRKETYGSGQQMSRNRLVETVRLRGGTTPFNVLATGRGPEERKHPAATPMHVCRWWTRYICPPGGTVLDPFIGSGTTALACLKEGRKCRGVERMPGYVEVIRNRLNSAD